MNSAFREIFGYPEDAPLEGSRVVDFVHEGEADRVGTHLSLRERGEGAPAAYETIGRRRDGTSFPILVQAAVAEGDDGTVNIAFITDISERKAVEERYRQAQERLQAIIEASPVPILVQDVNRGVRLWNRAAKSVFGWELEDLEEGTDGVIPADVIEESRTLWGRLVEGETITGHVTRRLREDGSEAIVRLHGAPLRDTEGKVEAAVFLAEDITERRELEERLHHSQRLEAVGQLAGGVAHDLNNLLTVIQSHTILALDGVEEPSVRPDLEGILSTVERATTLVSKLLTFGRRQVLREELLDVNEVLGKMETLLRRALREDILLEFDLGAELPPIEVDRAQLEQAIMNLAVNARDAMPDGGTLTIRTRLQSAGEREVPIEAFTWDAVVVEVSDTGTGMSKDVADRIFEPFFSTKGEAGTGLGLASLFGFVTQSGGDVAVDTESGCGSTFRVRLPVSSREEEPGTVGAVDEPGGPPAEGEDDVRVLLVDDNEQILELCRRHLTRQGFEVLTASAPRQAFALARENRDRIDVLVTDVILPGQRGGALAKEIVDVIPGLPVVFISGHVGTGSGREIEAVEDSVFLPKPFSPSALVEAIHEAIARGS